MKKSKYGFEKLLELYSGEYYDLDFNKKDELNIRNGAQNFARPKGFKVSVKKQGNKLRIIKR